MEPMDNGTDEMVLYGQVFEEWVVYKKDDGQSDYHHYLHVLKHSNVHLIILSKKWFDTMKHAFWEIR